MEITLPNIYPLGSNKDNLYYQDISIKIKNGSLIGELSDESKWKNQEVNLKNASHKILSVDDTHTTISTFDTPNGKLLEFLIKNKINIGFSTRMLNNTITSVDIVIPEKYILRDKLIDIILNDTN